VVDFMDGDGVDSGRLAAGAATALLSETEEQRQLRAVLRDLLAGECGPEAVREQVAGPRGWDRGLWERLAGEIGVHGLAVPEAYGGAGYSFAELAVALQETGRVLCPAPLLPTVVLAGYALLLSGDRRACARYLPRIAGGALTATVAGFAHSAGVAAERGGGGWVLRGAADFVLDGHGAGLLVVAAGTPDGGVRLFTCEPVAGTCVRTPRRVLDFTRRQALVEFRGAPAEPLGEPGEAPGVAAAVLDRGRAALAAEQVGGCGHVLGAVLDHVLRRHQFGRPIGSFQAVKHRLADVLVELEAARSASAFATACVAEDTARLPVAASAAAVVCSAAYRLSTAEYVQFHGGIGFTWEHSAHLYLRRARGDDALFGTADDHRARLAGMLRLAGSR
jgi:alkylation response protein AidB-like acyl-CoA dehydrogenase